MLAMQGASAAKGVKTLRNTPLPWEENENDSGKIRNPSVGPRLSFRIRSKGEREDAAVQQLRTCANGSEGGVGGPFFYWLGFLTNNTRFHRLSQHIAKTRLDTSGEERSDDTRNDTIIRRMSLWSRSL